MVFVPTTERRFKEGSGERYLKDGRTRCHAMSKAKLRRLRAERNDYDSDNDVFWPEAQCRNEAVYGKYACKFHGGESPTSKPKDVYDVLPYDLVEKLQLIEQQPDYISRKFDIQLMEARRLQLLEELRDEVGSDEIWDMLSESHRYMSKGDTVKAEALLQRALTSHVDSSSKWEEIYRIEDKLKDLTNTQVKTAKELRIMATAEQVTGIFAEVQRVFLMAGEEFFDDTVARSRFYEFVAKRIADLGGSRTAAFSAQLNSGS